MFHMTINAQRVINDAHDSDMKLLFSKPNKIYVIRYQHTFTDAITIPPSCEIRFEGGSICGRISFDNTKLTGDIRLQGSHISGSIKNKTFNASWLCYMDGNTDDAQNVNQILEVCHDVFFPKGVYRMQSAYQPIDLDESLRKSVKCHIGINKSHISLRGEQGTCFITDQVLGMITVYSQPYQIDKSIGNIKIEKIKFITNNDGKNFHEFIHVIKLIGVNGIKIRGCVFEDFWGDAICLSHYGDIPSTGERTRNQNVIFTDNTIIGGDHHNNRNGVSVVSGKNVLVKRNTIINTSRNDMPGGIAVEPNNIAYTIENIRIENNTLERIKGSGGAICVVMYKDGPGHRISILGNRISKSSNGVLIYIKTENTTDSFVIKNNIIARDTNPIYFKGEGKSKNWTISGNVFNSPLNQKMPGNIKVDNLTIKNNKKKD